MNRLPFSVIVSLSEFTLIALCCVLFLYARSEELARAAHARVLALEAQLIEQTQERQSVHQKLLDVRGELDAVVVVVDRSNSMRRGDRWDDARRTIGAWLEHLAIRRVALILFNDQVTTFPPNGTFLDLTGPTGTERRSSLVTTLSSATPTGRTNLLQALERAYAFEGVTSILLFSDGYPDSVGGRFDDRMAQRVYALTRAHGPRVPVNTIGLGDYFDRRLGEFLLRVARETGGSFRAF